MEPWNWKYFQPYCSLFYLSLFKGQRMDCIAGTFKMVPDNCGRIFFAFGWNSALGSFGILTHNNVQFYQA